jgi:hypothetical protein
MGDSGSALAILRNGRWFLRGIASFGHTYRKPNSEGVMKFACNISIPAFFQDVVYHMEWIQQNVVLGEQKPSPAIFIIILIGLILFTCAIIFIYCFRLKSRNQRMHQPQTEEPVEPDYEYVVYESQL